jgi:two-component system phosphate regulon sensor histidine kinase PhoR
VAGTQTSQPAQSPPSGGSRWDVGLSLAPILIATLVVGVPALLALVWPHLAGMNAELARESLPIRIVLVALGVMGAWGVLGIAVLRARNARLRLMIEARRVLERQTMLARDTGVAGGSGAGPATTQTEKIDPLKVGLGGLLHEIGERFERQVKEVAKKTRNLEALIDAVDEPLIATDDQERILLYNRSAEAILEVGPGELRGRPIREVITQAEVLDMHGAARAGQTRRGRARLTTPLGIRTFQVSALPVPAAWGEGIFGAVVVLRDVTELDQAVQVKTDFVANASHELRTPVAAIRGAAETLVDAIDDDPAMSRKLAKMVQTHAIRLEELLRDLLDLSRLESPEVPVANERVALEDVRRVLAQQFEHVCAQRRLTLAFEIEPELGEVVTDRKLLVLILRNLIENASKFAHEQTPIRVVGRLVEEEEVSPGQSRGIARFEVIDRGVGIPLQHQERVFERFFQVDPARSGAGLGAGSGGGLNAGTTPAPAGSRRGTGLGLAIVKHAAKRLGGQVGLTSVWGQGTTVWVEIPVGLAGSPGAGPPGGR